MRASWPSRRSCRARWRTWSLTPPAVAKSYGDTRPTLIARALGRSRPDAMRDVPLLRVPSNEALDVPQELLRNAYLVGLAVARVFRDHMRGGLRHERVVRQPVDAHRQ